MIGIAVCLLLVAVVLILAFREGGSTAPQPSRQRRVVQLTGCTGLFEGNIVGESHYQEALGNLYADLGKDGRERIFDAYLIPEDDNPHDSQAVRVEIGGELVGYLSRANARTWRVAIARQGYPDDIIQIPAKIVGGWDKGRGDIGLFGVKIDLPIN